MADRNTQARPGEPAGPSSAPGPLLDVRGLTVGFNTEGGPVRVLEGVSYQVGHGRTIGLVGESGCGKSVSAMTIMRLLPSPPSFVESGQVLLEGRDLLGLDAGAIRRVRGNNVGMIFQEPMTSLNPTFSIGFQLAEVLRLHRGMSAAQAREESVRLIEMIGVGAPEKRLGQYPYELSGGLRQRMMIAMALACRPKLLIADEPTTALDVTIQAQILELMKRLQEELGMSILLITHDLGVVAETCDFVYVMYAGRIVEQAPAQRLFEHQAHPYTRGLLGSIPRLDRKRKWLPTIPGMVPGPAERGRGCHFAERCQYADEHCRETPALRRLGPGHRAACWHPLE